MLYLAINFGRAKNQSGTKYTVIPLQIEPTTIYKAANAMGWGNTSGIQKIMFHRSKSENVNITRIYP